MTLITYRHDVKRGNLASKLFRNLRYVRYNSKYWQKKLSRVKIEKIYLIDNIKCIYKN